VECRLVASNRSNARGPIRHILGHSCVSCPMLSFRKSGGEGGAIFTASSLNVFEGEEDVCTCGVVASGLVN